jgi:hypothetical protein
MPNVAGTPMPADQGLHFFAPAAEYERIATLDARHNVAGARQVYELAFDESLWRRPAAPAFSHFDHPGGRWHELQDLAADQVVEQHDVGLTQRLHRFQRQQLDVAGAGPDQKHLPCRSHSVSSLWTPKMSIAVMPQKPYQCCK